MDVASPAPVELYVGSVMHARLREPKHRFRYRLLWLLVDIDRLQEAERACPLFSVGRWNLLSFSPRDHGPADGSPLRRHIDRLLSRSGIEATDGRVLLLCCPRVLGRVFNPLSVYFVYRADGALAATVYEVRNTFGERHVYVEPVAEGTGEMSVITQDRGKSFHVSPFLPMNLRYRFRLSRPAETLRLRILALEGEKTVLSTAIEGERRPMQSGQILSALAGSILPLFGNLTGIHVEALRLWLAGAQIFRHPDRKALHRLQPAASPVDPPPSSS